MKILFHCLKMLLYHKRDKLYKEKSLSKNTHKLFFAEKMLNLMCTVTYFWKIYNFNLYYFYNLHNYQKHCKKKLILTNELNLNETVF